ncbi:MAG: EAL domain-containing protein [Rhodospirillales bacterium]|nr:MAG: EAL domain-containing protein [Rhodospirillales bacterium]
MSGERELLMAIAEVRKSPFGKRVVHFFASWAKGDPQYNVKLEKAREYITRSVFIGRDTGCFVLSSGDIVFVCAQISSGLITTLCSRLEAVFFGREEPKSNMYGEVKFYKIFDAGRDLSSLIGTIKKMVAAPKIPDRPPIGFKEYDDVIKVIRNSDIRTVVFNQPIYMSSDVKPCIEYLEFYVSINQLSQMACPEYNIAGNNSLFSMIKADLDLRLMRIISREIGEYRHKAFAINLLGSTFLSKEFEAFISSVPARLSGKIYVEIDRADFLQHSGDLEQLQQRSEKLNVPICIDGVSLSDLRVFRLPFSSEFVKVKWSEQITGMPLPDLEVAIRSLRECGTTKIVLSRCDSERSLEFAKALGIHFVQGRLVDQLFRAGVGFTEARAG